ncbi:putative WD-repeat protein [Reticulomyxa filosa]|uniref:Putative WD-repeat protein n=1 Tax=Reticulomyxa filosa TaxID=46433 RepID=X6PEC5_RETFI|nr:putative WD-repeat protein [Reticulomyxa filosa]|eukprot:ETO36855.1 putative WD-repeat protein [Reticulomyxa filosa]
MIGGNGYTICSGSFDNTIRIWDIETTKQLNIFKGHEDWVNSVKYGSNELLNQYYLDHVIKVFICGIFDLVNKFKSCVEYSPFVIKNNGSNSNVICSGSLDNTIRFWDIRSNNEELYVIKGSDEIGAIFCLKFVLLKKTVNNNEQKLKDDCGIHLYYGSTNSRIYVCG